MAIEPSQQVPFGQEKDESPVSDVENPHIDQGNEAVLVYVDSEETRCATAFKLAKDGHVR
jgi:hypothetical protein